jgi:DNA polymerase I
MTETTDQIILVDGSSYLYRAFHAMPSLMNSSGDATGAAFGVVNMVRRLLLDYRPTHVAMVFDAKGKTFRDDMYPEYKANRPSMPDELRSQIEPIHTIVEAMGLPLVMESGVEADDVIGTLAHQAVAQGMSVVISTGDKDMAQLVGPGITLVNTMDGVVLDEDGVKAKFGVRPDQIIDYLALIGDTVDNVPGVPKVGPKTAVKWLDAHDTVDGVVAVADEIKGKVGEYLRESLDQLALSRTLVTIKCDVPMARTPRELAVTEPDNDALREMFARMEFKTWLSELLGDEADAAEPQLEEYKGEYETILDSDRLEAWIERLKAADLIAVDTETTSVNYMEAELVGLSFAVQSGEAAYVPVAHRHPGAPDQLSLSHVLEAMRPVLESEDIAKVGQNIKYDMSVLARHGIDLRGAQFDTMLESYVLDSTATRHDMDSLALKYLGYRTVHFEDVAGKGAKQLRFDDVPLEDAGPYAAEDADITLRLHEALWPKVGEEPTLVSVFESIEMPLVPILARIERTGVMVDAGMLAAHSGRLGKRIVELEGLAHTAAGHPFNLGSPKQIQAILFEELGLPVLSKTPKGQPSTAESVLQELAHEHDLPRLILEHREVSKLKSTYTDALPLCIDANTGRVHTSYRQAVAATGRLSSSDPNLQNIPVRSEEGRLIRQAFVAPPGQILLAADYSQIELRIMAHLSGDEGLLSAFAAGADIHAATAAEVFGSEGGAVGPDERRSAKAINFGLIYGMSAFGLARQLGIDRARAQNYVDLYFTRYPGVKAYMDRIREEAHDNGFVETVFGRRLYLPEINARNAQRRQYAERTAINAPMQGSAADIIKRAMISLDAWMCAHEPPMRIVMQVHDELVFEVSEGYVEEAKAVICEHMEGAAKLAVPLIVDVGTGHNWDEAH